MITAAQQAIQQAQNAAQQLPAAPASTPASTAPVAGNAFTSAAQSVQNVMSQFTPEQIAAAKAASAAPVAGNAFTSATKAVQDVAKKAEEIKTTADTKAAAAAADAQAATSARDENAARQMAETAAMGGQSRAMGAARAAGLSGAAGASAGAKEGTDAYSNVYPNANLQLQGLSTQRRGQDIGLQGQKYGYDAAIAMERAKAEAAQEGTAWQTGSAIAAPFVTKLLSLFPSDRNLKTKVEEISDMRMKPGDDVLSHVARHVKGKYYEYKNNPGRKEMGVMAQDLEKTPLSSTVVDTPEGKMVDTRRLTTANTAMISDLSRKLDKAMEYIGGMK